MAFESKPTGTFKTLVFRVWGLDVWGHAADDCEVEHEKDCCEAASDSFVLGEDDDGAKDACDCDRHEQCDGYTVNDRTKFGTIEVRAEGQRWNVGTPQEFTSFHPTDKAVIDALIAALYLEIGCTEETIEIDGDWDFSLAVDRKSDGRPLLQIEREALNDEDGSEEDSKEYPIEPEE